MKITFQNSGLFALVAFLAFSSLPSEAATHTVNCPGQSLQAKLDDSIVLAGDTIQVSGTCGENVLVRNEKQRLTIQGTGVSPTINGPDTNLPTINVRSKGILVHGFSITGGSSGIQVTAGSNDGIHLRQNAHATIAANNIESNNVGILIELKASVDLNDIFAGPLFLNSANNSNAGPNGSGLLCLSTGGYVYGPIGTLTGTFPTVINSPCQDIIF